MGRSLLYYQELLETKALLPATSFIYADIYISMRIKKSAKITFRGFYLNYLKIHFKPSLPGLRCRY